MNTVRLALQFPLFLQCLIYARHQARGITRLPPLRSKSKNHPRQLLTTPTIPAATCHVWLVLQWCGVIPELALSLQVEISWLLQRRVRNRSQQGRRVAAVTNGWRAPMLAKQMTWDLLSSSAYLTGGMEHRFERTTECLAPQLWPQRGMMDVSSSANRSSIMLTRSICSCHPLLPRSWAGTPNSRRRDDRRSADTSLDR